MATVQNLLAALDERAIAREVAIPHDEARMAYSLRSNTIPDFRAFEDLIGDYLNYHYARCVTHGGTLSRDDAIARAKEILERALQRKNGNLITAFNDARDGTNGGLRHVLDTLAESLKVEAVERYVRQAFDRTVAPHSWEEKVDLIRQFFAHCGAHLSSDIRRDQPERYAHNYLALVRSFATALQQTSSIFRRL